jgi:hypothetical protein
VSLESHITCHCSYKFGEILATKYKFTFQIRSFISASTFSLLFKQFSSVEIFTQWAEPSLSPLYMENSKMAENVDDADCREMLEKFVFS